MDGSTKFESLDTSYVDLESLIRYLRDRNFVGRLHVALDQYEADIFLYGADSRSVWESDHSTGSRAQGDAAMERLLVRAREPGGLITVYERTAPEQASVPEPVADSSRDLEATIEATRLQAPAENVDWDELLRVSGDLIAAVERAVESAGTSFAQHFHAARVELGDDYPFLDPSVGGFEYANAVVQLRERPGASTYISSLTECLRRTVSKFAKDDRSGARLRERVAVELVVAVRKHGNSLAEFRPHLDRIAGTRVL